MTTPHLVHYSLPECDRYLLFNPASGAWLVTDSRGDGMITEYLERRGPAGPFIERLARTPIFKQIEEGSAYGLVPQRLIVELTTACNLRCKTCYMSASLSRDNEMKFEEVTSLLRDAAAGGTETVAFIGGEPLMRSDLPEVLDFALANFADVMLSTNGTLVDQSFLSQFSRRRNLLIQVSIDGPDETSNDAIRGRGSFVKATRLLDLARECGIRTAVSSVLNRCNYDLVGRTCDLAAAKGASLAIFHKVHVFGRAQDFPEIVPSKEQVMHGMGVLLQRFDQYERAGKMIVDFPHNRCFRGDSALDTAFLGCHFGRASAYVTSDGNLVCCSHLRDGEFRCGDLRERALLEIWQNSPCLDRMRKMTVEDIPSCRKCQFKYMCRGSCRADALGHSGDLSGEPYDCDALRSYYAYVLDYYARHSEPVIP
ncbi:MAG: radical SAM protein [Candidatus Eisenbacteria bacterium]